MANKFIGSAIVCLWSEGLDPGIIVTLNKKICILCVIIYSGTEITTVNHNDGFSTVTGLGHS